MAFGEEAGTEAGSAGDDFDDFDASETDGGAGGGGGGGNAGGSSGGGGGGGGSGASDDDAAEDAQDTFAGSDLNDDPVVVDDFEADKSDTTNTDTGGTSGSSDGGAVVADDVTKNRTDSAEAAEDLAGAGVTTGATQPEDAAEGAQDLAATGLTTTKKSENKPSDDPAEAAQDFFGALNARDIRTDAAEAAQDRAARTATRPEQFGDVDTSATLDALGLGQPGVDEVERFTDKTLPGAVDELLPREAAPDSSAAPDPATVSAGPFVSPGASLGRVAGPGSPIRGAARELAVGAAEAPGALLEGIEAAPGVATAPAEAFLSENEAGFIGPEPSAEQERTAEDIGGAVGRSATSTAEAVREEPVEEAVGLGLGVALSAGGGLALGRGARFLRGRARTVGATQIDTTDVVGQDVADTFDPNKNPDVEQDFPPFRDPGVGPDTQADAIKRQADEFTPDEIEDEFGRPASEVGEDVVDLKKALDTEPEGEGGGPGFQAPPSDTDAAEAYETPGTSVGPELSPYFLGTSGRSRFSLRPGLPDLGSQPTGAVIRTELTDTDARNVDEFRDELLAAEEVGATDARTLPPDEFSPGEAEAVVPPGAAFRQVSDQSFLRRLGVGSDFAVDVAGTRVPIRLFRDPDLDVDSADDVRRRGDEDLDVSDLDDDLTKIEEIRRRARVDSDPVDRPLPPVTSGGGREVTRPTERKTTLDESGVSSRAPSSPPASGSGVSGGFPSSGGPSSGAPSSGPPSSAPASSEPSSRPSSGPPSSGGPFSGPSSGGPFSGPSSGGPFSGPSSGGPPGTPTTPTPASTVPKVSLDPEDERREFDADLDVFERVDEFDVAAPGELDDLTEAALGLSGGGTTDVDYQSQDFTEGI